MEKNSSEHFDNNDIAKWLKNELYGIVAQIPLEPDCDTLDEQLSRDLYYQSNGAQIDLAYTEELEVLVPGTEFILRPIGETSAGVVCEDLFVNTSDHEPELIVICGTLFTSEKFFSEDEPLTIHRNCWPEQNEPVATMAQFDSHYLMILNRRVATSGYLAYRPTFSPQEWKEYSSQRPDYFNEGNFDCIQLVINGISRVRAVPKEVSVIGRTTMSIKAKSHKGTTQEHDIWQSVL